MLAALREAIRRREVWVVGAVRWRNNPDVDLPADSRAPVGALRADRATAGPTEFIDTLRSELSTALGDLDAALGVGDTGGVSIGARAGRPLLPLVPDGSEARAAQDG